jgi:hypothetical protein
MDYLPVLDRIDLPATWTRTPSHLVVEAGSQTIGKLGVKAGPDGKESSDQLQGLPKGGGRRIRAKIDGAIFLDPPHDAQGWKFFLHGEPEARIILIVPELHIITGMVYLNKVVFQDEGLFFCIGDDGFDVCDLLQHRQSLHIFFGRPLKIGIDPVFDIPGLPHIEDDPLAIFKKIDTGIRRKVIDFLFQCIHL